MGSIEFGVGNVYSCRFMIFLAQIYTWLPKFNISLSLISSDPLENAFIIMLFPPKLPDL